MSDPIFLSQDRTIAYVWDLLEQARTDRTQATRHPTLATIGTEGPAARTVVLRGVDRQAGHLEIHTDRRSAKVADVMADPRCEIHVWEEKADLQIRLKALASVLSGEEVALLWQRIPLPARRVYGGFPPPGEVLATPEDHEATLGPADQFCVLQLKVQVIETLHLGADRHRRLRSTRGPDGWTSQWIAP